MDLLLSLKELFEMHKAGFIAIAIAIVLLLICIILLIVRHKINKKNTVENPEVYLIRQTLKEDEINQKQTKTASNKASASSSPKEEQPKPDSNSIEEYDKKIEAEVKLETAIETKPQKQAKAPKEETKVENEVPKEEKPKKQAKAPLKEEANRDKEVEMKKEDKSKKQAKAPQKEEVKEEKAKRTVFGKYEIYFDGAKYFYQLKASNGEILVVSELYTSKDGVYNAIDAVKRNVVDGRVVVGSDKRGLYQFTLLAKNHRKLVMSANYPTEKGAINASESFKRFAHDAKVYEIDEQATNMKEEIQVDRSVNKKGGKIGIVNENNRFYYQLKASNGEVLICSDGYKTNDLATNALETFKEAIKSGSFFIEKDKRGMYQFKIYSGSGRLIVAGETYPSKQNAINACNSMMSFVKYATPLE